MGTAARPRQEFLRVLQLVSNVSQPSTSDGLDELQLVANFFQCGIPLEAAILVRDHKFGSFLLVAVPDVRHDPANEFVGDEANDHSNWQRERSQHKTNGPLRTLAKARHRKGRTANEDDQHLTSDDDELDADEPLVAPDALHDVEFVVDPTRVVLVEDLHKDKGVEHHRLHVFGVPRKDRLSGKVEHKRHD